MTAGSPARWVDSHCHLDSFENPAEILGRAAAAGVGAMVCVGTDVASSRRAVELAHAHGEIWATVGLHPHDSSRLDEQWGGLVELASLDRVVGIGEAGFDFHYMNSPPEDQERAFRAHVALAKESGRALVIHTREAWDDTFRVLEEEGVPARTVFHCFTGGSAEAQRAVALGASVSFSGIVTFKGADDVRRAAGAVPPERLLVETDSPYLAPVPHRGERNEPAYVVQVGAAVAEVRGETAESVAALTRANAEQMFRLA